MSVYKIKDMKKANLKCRANFTIDEKLMIRFRRYCQKNGISMSHRVESWIRDFMKDRE